MIVIESDEVFEKMMEKVLTKILPKMLEKRVDRMFTTEEAAEYLRISTKTLSRWARSGKIRCSKPGYKALFSESDLNEALIRNKH